MSNASHRQPPSSLDDTGEASQRPPRYSTLSLATLPLYPTAGELDISHAGGLYNGRDSEPESKQAFDFCLQDKGSSAHGEARAWATLRLFSMVPAALQRPRYTGGENIEGLVQLDLKRPQTILSVSVVLRGQMLTSSRSDGAHCFLEIVTPIWDRTMALQSSGASARSASTSGKLEGKYVWPFSIPFPAEFPDSFATSGKQSKKQQDDARTMYSTPQTVCQRGINANIQYEVTLKINTSGLFNSKHRVSATVLYVPMIRAPPLPPLRASAYANGSFLVGPEDDPTGWQPLPTFCVHAAADGGPKCDIECTVYIANPTTYTRGSVIPCYLLCRTSSVDDDGKSLLHAFTSQNCVSLDLLQRVQCHQDPRAAAGPIVGNGHVKTGQGSKSDRNQHSEDGGTAVWWTPRARVGQGAVEGSGLGTKLSLEGEIHIDIGLLPTCKVPFLEASHEVQVSLKPSEGFKITTVPEDDVLPAWKVGVVTAHASGGLIPAAFTPRPPRKRKDLSAVQEVQYDSNAFSG